MVLTPLDISNKEFSRSLRGYDIDEVNEFLDRIIKDYEGLIRENKALQEQIRTLEERTSHYAKLEENLTKSIVVAQEASEEMISNAKKEGKLIIREAEKNADRIINEAVLKAHKASMDVEDLKKQAKMYRARLRSLIEAQLELISSEDWEELNEIAASRENSD